MAKRPFRMLFSVNDSKEKTGIVAIMELVIINGMLIQFSCNRRIAKEFRNAKGNRVKGKNVKAGEIAHIRLRGVCYVAGMVRNSTVSPGLDPHCGSNELTYVVVHFVVKIHPYVASAIFLKPW